MLMVPYIWHIRKYKGRLEAMKHGAISYNIYMHEDVFASYLKRQVKVSIKIRKKTSGIMKHSEERLIDIPYLSEKNKNGVMKRSEERLPQYIIDEIIQKRFGIKSSPGYIIFSGDIFFTFDEIEDLENNGRAIEFIHVLNNCLKGLGGEGIKQTFVQTGFDAFPEEYKKLIYEKIRKKLTTDWSEWWEEPAGIDRFSIWRERIMDEKKRILVSESFEYTTIAGVKVIRCEYEFLKDDDFLFRVIVKFPESGNVEIIIEDKYSELRKEIYDVFRVKGKIPNLKSDDERIKLALDCMNNYLVRFGKKLEGIFLQDKLNVLPDKYKKIVSTLNFGQFFDNFITK